VNADFFAQTIKFAIILILLLAEVTYELKCVRFNNRPVLCKNLFFLNLEIISTQTCWLYRQLTSPCLPRTVELSLKIHWSCQMANFNHIYNVFNVLINYTNMYICVLKACIIHAIADCLSHQSGNRIPETGGVREGESIFENRESAHSSL